MTGGVDGGGRLDSWKEIAAYLGKDAGTARRWERARGLPVHRVPGGKGTSVYAYTAEIDAWLVSAGQESADEDTQADSSPASRRHAPLPRVWVWAATSLAVISVVAAWTLLPLESHVDPSSVQVHITEQSVNAVNGEGRQLWTYPLAEGWRHIKTEVSAYSAIVTGTHPRVYFVTSHRQKPNSDTVEGGEFTALDLDGRPQFTFRFFDNVRFGGKPYGEPWAVTAFSALDGDPAPRLAVAAHHWLWGPSLLAILDGKGNRLGTFANDGWIEQLEWLSPDRLVFGGFSESKNGGMVGLLDPRELDGQSPEPPASPHYCDTCGKHLPLRMIVMPRTEVNLMTASRFNRAIIERAGDRVIVRTVEVPAADGQGAADAIYEFSPTLELISASFGEYYWRIHDRLAAEKKIDHDREHCPFRNGPGPISIWSPASGWTVLSTN
jgi:hypothetical protein